jgi:hypothetical protein
MRRRGLGPASASARGALAVLTFLAAVASTPEARAADVAITDEARTHFAAGVALLQDPKAPRYEEAYLEFRSAYAASPSYKILGNLGLCAMKIERDKEAIDAYEKYLAWAGDELAPAEREQIQRDLLTLKAGVVQVSVSSSPPGATITDVRTPVQGPDVRNTYGEADAPFVLWLRRGHHVITAKLAGYLDAQWELEASGATLHPHVFEMVKPTVASPVVHERPVPTSAYVSGGATLALLLAGTITGIKALQDHSDYTRLNDGTHVAEATSLHGDGQRLDIVTDVVFGTAIVAAGLTAYFMLSRPTIERPAPGTAFIAPKRLLPSVVAHGGGAAFVWDL